MSTNLWVSIGGILGLMALVYWIVYESRKLEYQEKQKKKK